MYTTLADVRRQSRYHSNDIVCLGGNFASFVLGSLPDQRPPCNSAGRSAVSTSFDKAAENRRLNRIERERSQWERNWNIRLKIRLMLNIP